MLVYSYVAGKCTTPPHSQLIHNHDAEVCAPIASCRISIFPSV